METTIKKKKPSGSRKDAHRVRGREPIEFLADCSSCSMAPKVDSRLLESKTADYPSWPEMVESFKFEYM